MVLEWRASREYVSGRLCKAKNVAGELGQPLREMERKTVQEVWDILAQPEQNESEPTNAASSRSRVETKGMGQSTILMESMQSTMASIIFSSSGTSAILVLHPFSKNLGESQLFLRISLNS